MKKVLLTVVFILVIGFVSTPAYAPWIWTPDGGWMNEKDMVKESPKAQWEHAQSLEEKGEYNNAVRAYQSLIKTYPTSPLAPRSQEKVAFCYRREGFLYKAFQAYQKLIENYPQEIDFEDVLQQQYQIGELFLSGKKRKLWRLPIIPAQDKGIEIMQTVVTNAPFSDIAPQAQFKIALAYKKRGKYAESVEAFNKLIEDYSESPWYEESLYQLGMCNYKKSRGASYDQDAAKEAIIVFQKFQREFPHSKHITKVTGILQQLQGRQSKGLLEVARFYDKHKHYKAAVMYYQELLEKFPESAEVQYATKRLEKIKKKLK